MMKEKANTEDGREGRLEARASMNAPQEACSPFPSRREPAVGWACFRKAGLTEVLRRHSYFRASVQ